MFLQLMERVVRLLIRSDLRAPGRCCRLDPLSLVSGITCMASMAAASRDVVCRRMITVPGVGSATALTNCSAVDYPVCFSRSRPVGAHFGLTPRRYQSGGTDRTGHISKQGDALARQALYEAANVLLTRTSRWSTLKARGLSVAKRAGTRRAKVAVARKLATVLHPMWRDGTEFCWSQEAVG